MEDAQICFRFTDSFLQILDKAGFCLSSGGFHCKTCQQQLIRLMRSSVWIFMVPSVLTASCQKFAISHTVVRLRVAQNLKSYMKFAVG